MAIKKHYKVRGTVVGHSSRKRFLLIKYPSVKVRIDDGDYEHLKGILDKLSWDHSTRFDYPSQIMEVGLNGKLKIGDLPVDKAVELQFSTCSRLMLNFYGRYGVLPFSWDGITVVGPILRGFGISRTVAEQRWYLHSGPIVGGRFTEGLMSDVVFGCYDHDLLITGDLLDRGSPPISQPVDMVEIDVAKYDHDRRAFCSLDKPGLTFLTADYALLSADGSIVIGKKKT